MLIVVLGDTHGCSAAKALDGLGEVDLILHTGDNYWDAGLLGKEVKVPVHAVVGNCDVREEGPPEKILVLDSITVLLTHGHLLGVNISCQGLLRRAKEKGASVAVFGHTHLPHIEVVDELLLFNPGSFSRPRGGHRPSLGLLEIKEGRVNPRLLYL